MQTALQLSALPKSRREEICQRFINRLTPCQIRAWAIWYPNHNISEMMELHMLRGRRFPIVEGGKIDSTPKPPFSYTPTPEGGNAA